MQFKYVATNKEGKKLTGIINAPDEAVARTQLNNLGFSILEIKPFQEKTSSEQTNGQKQIAIASNARERGPASGGLPDGGRMTPIRHAPELGGDLPTGQAGASPYKFQFDALDTGGKKIKGTIPAQSALLAYQRLVEEYHFTPLAFAPAVASPEEKSQWKTLKFEQLKNEYELSFHEKKKGDAMTPLAESPEFLAKKQKLIDEVEAILQKIKGILGTYERKISPDKKATIQGYMDKLLRIKSSNNLDYIANTCKELLTKIQQEELFLESQEHHEERKTLFLESQKMMMELNKAVAHKKNLVMDLKSGLGGIEHKLASGPFGFLLKPLEALQHWFEVPREMELMNTQIKVLKEQRWDAIKIALKTPKETRTVAWNEVKKIHQQIKALQTKKKQFLRLRMEQNKLLRREQHRYLLKEINAFTGWLLAFYLTYYFFGYYVELHDFPLKPFLGIPFKWEESVLFKYLLAWVFLFHMGTSLKINFFERSRPATAVLICTVVLLSALTLFNF